MSQSEKDAASTPAGIRTHRPRLVPRRQMAARIVPGMVPGSPPRSQTHGQAGLFPSLGARIDRIEARVDAGVEQALGKPLDRMALAIENRVKALTPAGRKARGRGAAAAPAMRVPAEIAAPAMTQARAPEVPAPQSAPDLAPAAPVPAAGEAAGVAAHGPVEGLRGDAPGTPPFTIPEREPGPDDWARMALARAGVLSGAAAPASAPMRAPWETDLADAPAPVPAPQPVVAPAILHGRSSLVSGLTPLDELEAVAPAPAGLASDTGTAIAATAIEPVTAAATPEPRDVARSTDPFAMPTHDATDPLAQREDRPEIEALAPLDMTRPALPDAVAVAPSLYGSSLTLPAPVEAGRKTRRAGSATRARISARPVRPSRFAKARLALQWQWAALRYRLRSARIAAPAGATGLGSRIGTRLGEGVSRRTLTRGLLAVLGSVALVLGGHALFIAGLARWRAPAPATQPATTVARPANPAAPGGSGQAGAPAAMAPRLEPRTPQDFAALPATYPLLLGLPIRPDRPIILPAPNDALDGTTIRAGAQIIKLARVDGPDAYAVCEGADGAPWACGLRARAALHNLVSQDQLTCRPVTEIGQRERRHVCEIAGQDVARLMVTAGWLRPDTHSEWAYGADASRARAGGEGLWRGGWRIRQR